MRTPVYKKAILEQFNEHHLLTLAELKILIPGADYSTLFRNIKALVMSKDLKQINISKHRIFYEHADHSHDHLVCDGCGNIQIVKIPRPSGVQFMITDILVRGLCADCT